MNELLDTIRDKYDLSKLKEQFNNVYFIIGTAYAGKSTMIKMLSSYYDGICCEENYGLRVIEEQNINLDPISFPNLTYTSYHTMVEFVSRTPEEYTAWLDGSQEEITPIEIDELDRLTKSNPNKYIFVDTSIPLCILKEISDYNHIAIMLCDKSLSVGNFFDRDDYEKQIILRAINKTPDPVKTRENYNKILELANSDEIYDSYNNSGYYVFVRDNTKSLDETRDILASHFNLEK